MSTGVLATGERMEINGLNCNGYYGEMKLPTGIINSEVWMTSVILTDYRLDRELVYSIFLDINGFNNVLEQFEKLNGIDVIKNMVTEEFGQIVHYEEKLLHYADNLSESDVYNVLGNYIKNKFNKKLLFD